jgi:serine/threonine protein kinase
VASDKTKATHQNLTSKDETLGDGETTRGDQTSEDSLGFDLDESDELLETIGKFECRELLGKGGMGSVYLGFDPLIEREVAIKVLPKSLSEDETAITRFLVEARAIGQLNHPNVIAIYDIGRHDDRFFIVTELAPGGNVASLMKEQGRMSFADACGITLHAARGLQAAHSAGIVHRDVKPENLMLSADKMVKLVDFGLAKAIDRSRQLAITAKGQILGTPMYMAPEQIEDGDVDARTDIYSLGATFYHLLTGQPPFDADTITKVLFAHVSGPRPDPRKLAPNLPASCSDVIAKAMAIDPANRYETMGALIEDVEHLLEHDSLDVASTQFASAANHAPRVLLIEPSNLLAKLTCEVLEKAGCRNVAHVSTAEDAIAHVQDHSIDVAIASRQLAGADGKDLLQTVRASAGSSPVMCVLTSSDSLRELMTHSRLKSPAAYARKQASMDELVRAIYVSTHHRFSDLPFRDQRQDIAVTVLSEDGTVPGHLGQWLGDLGVTDVAASSLGDLAQSSLQSRNLIIWLDQLSATDIECAARLIGATAQRIVGDDATVAIVTTADSKMKLRGVKRSSFLATCDRQFDREGLERLLSIATKLGHQRC